MQPNGIKPRNRRTVPRACGFCGVAFLAIPYEVNRGLGQFCSRRCAARFVLTDTVGHPVRTAQLLPPDGTARPCTQCGEVKPADAFSPRPDRLSGRMSCCKACSAKRRHAHRLANPLLREKERESKRVGRKNNPAYEQSERRKASYRTYRAAHPEVTQRAVAAYQARNPDKVAAHKAVQKAVKAGDLTKTTCQDCGISRVEGHHHLGYAPEHRLDVVWLCRMHHRAAHRL